MVILQVNGSAHPVDLDSDVPLLWVLRDELRLTGTKYGFDVAQCGYCQSGQIMSAIALLSEIPQPKDSDIDAAMSGNVCRCATYVRIRAAIHDAARTVGA
jgi:aerobic-type carbon monoxide dehydrogenase small subunit (CoxS/CutS family)